LLSLTQQRSDGFPSTHTSRKYEPPFTTSVGQANRSTSHFPIPTISPIINHLHFRFQIRHRAPTFSLNHRPGITPQHQPDQLFPKSPGCLPIIIYIQNSPRPPNSAILILPNPPPPSWPSSPLHSRTPSGNPRARQRRLRSRGLRHRSAGNLVFGGWMWDIWARLGAN
jgi:hypothetical protein